MTKNAPTQASAAIRAFAETMRSPSEEAYIDKLRAHGLSSLVAGKPKVTVASLKFVCAARPKDALAHKVMGAALAQIGQHRRAAQHLGIACDLDGNDVEAQCLLGETHMALVAYKAAFECFSRCLALDPDAKHPHGVRARMLIRRLQRTLEEVVK